MCQKPASISASSSMSTLQEVSRIVFSADRASSETRLLRSKVCQMIGTALQAMADASCKTLRRRVGQRLRRKLGRILMQEEFEQALAIYKHYEDELLNETEDMEKVWEQRFEKRSKVLLACLREAVQVMEEVPLEVEFAPLVRERKEDFVYELSMATFPVVCLDASPSTTPPLMVTLAAFDVEVLGKAMDGGVELQTFGRCQKVPSERATSGSWPLDTAARGGTGTTGTTGTTELLEPLGGQRGGFDKVEPESWLQTVRLRDQLEEEHRQMRLLDAKLQAIVKERCRHEGFPRLADMEDSLEPEPDVDDMLLLPLHINEVLRVLREAHRSPVQSDVICVPLRSAQMSVAVGEALEETKSRSSCAALSEVSLLLYQLSGKEVPEPTLAPQEGRCGSPRTIGSFAGRRPGEPPARFPKPRPSGANA